VGFGPGGMGLGVGLGEGLGEGFGVGFGVGFGCGLPSVLNITLFYNNKYNYCKIIIQYKIIYMDCLVETIL